MSTENKDRLSKWVRFSHCLGKIEPFMVMTIQGLGTLDIELDENYHTSLGVGTNETNMIEFSRHMSISQLWVMGGYEIIRTIDEYAKENPSVFGDLNNDIKEAKQKFAKIRIPLAKFKSDHNKKNSSRVAYPVFNKVDIGWKTGPNEVIFRKELSEILLSLLEKLYEHNKN